MVHVLLGAGSLLLELLLGDPDTVVDELAPAELLGEVVGVKCVRVVGAHAAGSEKTSVAMELLEKPERQNRTYTGCEGASRHIKVSKNPIPHYSGNMS